MKTHDIIGPDRCANVACLKILSPTHAVLTMPDGEELHFCDDVCATDSYEAFRTAHIEAVSIGDHLADAPVSDVALVALLRERKRAVDGIPTDPSAVHVHVWPRDLLPPRS